MLSCRCCSSSPGSSRLGRGTCFPAAQQSSQLSPHPCGDTASPPRAAGSPLAWPSVWPLHLYLPWLCRSNFQLVSLRAFLISRCCRDRDVLVQTKLWNGAIGRAPGPAPGPRCSRTGVGASPDACGAGQGQGGSLSAEARGDLGEQPFHGAGALESLGAGQPG